MLFSIVVLTFIFIIGLVIGSFLNVVILRTVSEESIVLPASKCPKCQTPLKWYHNIPVLSYLFLKGRCAFCDEKISIQYPIVELFTGLIFVGLFVRFCNPFDPILGMAVMNPISWSQVIVYVFSLLVAFFFIAIAGTDILEKKVSDAHTYPLIGLGIAYSVLYSITSFIAYTKAHGIPQINPDFFLTCPVLYSLAAGILGFLIMEAISRLGLITVGTRAFGEGDSYIAAGLGTVFGALLGCSPFYPNFLPIFKTIVAILALSGIIQIIITLPLFIKKLIQNKNWSTLIYMAVFVILAIIYIVAQYNGWLEKTVVYWTSTIILVLSGILTCKNLVCGLKENKGQGGMYLPFGPAMIAAGFITLFTVLF